MEIARGLDGARSVALRAPLHRNPPRCRHVGEGADPGKATEANCAAAQADITKWLAAGPRIHNIAGQFALSDTAQAHLAVEKGDKLGTVIVDCAR